MKRRSNRFLTWAIAISLAAHAVVIYWAQDLHVSHADPAPPTEHFRFDHPHLKPPPPPMAIVTPKPVVPVHPQQTTLHRPPTPPVVPDNGGAKTAEYPPGPVTPIAPIGPPDVGPTGPAEPTQSPAPSCTAPDIAAHVVFTAAADTPEIAREQGATGTTQVEVSIDPDGKITATSIYRSSGSQALDNAALAAARQSTYKADVRDCEAVAGSYLFTVVFQ